jgi:hypothetical protein
MSASNKTPELVRKRLKERITCTLSVSLKGAQLALALVPRTPPDAFHAVNGAELAGDAAAVFFFLGHPGADADLTSRGSTFSLRSRRQCPFARSYQILDCLPLSLALGELIRVFLRFLQLLKPSTSHLYFIRFRGCRVARQEIVSPARPSRLCHGCRATASSFGTSRNSPRLRFDSDNFHCKGRMIEFLDHDRSGVGPDSRGCVSSKQLAARPLPSKISSDTDYFKRM